MSTSLDSRSRIAVFNDLRTYIAQADAYLAGTRSDPPDPQLIVRCAPTPSILAMTFGCDSDGPFIAATIRHKEQHQPRLFDPWYMVVLLLLERSGGRLRFHGNMAERDARRHLYVVFSASTKEQGLVRALRIITGVEHGEITQQLPGDHRDYRRIGLDKLVWSRVGSRPVKGREAAIALALRIFSRAPHADDLPDYEKLLRHALQAADKLHAAYWSEPKAAE